MKPRKLTQHWLSVVLGTALAKWGPCYGDDRNDWCKSLEVDRKCGWAVEDEDPVLQQSRAIGVAWTTD